MFNFLTEKSEELPLDEFLDVLLDKTGYLDYLKTLENADTKIENVQNFVPLWRSICRKRMNHRSADSLRKSLFIQKPIGMTVRR